MQLGCLIYLPGILWIVNFGVKIQCVEGTLDKRGLKMAFENFEIIKLHSNNFLSANFPIDWVDIKLPKKEINMLTHQSRHVWKSYNRKWNLNWKLNICNKIFECKLLAINIKAKWSYHTFQETFGISCIINLCIFSYFCLRRHFLIELGEWICLHSVAWDVCWGRFFNCLSNQKFVKISNIELCDIVLVISFHFPENIKIRSAVWVHYSLSKFIPFQLAYWTLKIFKNPHFLL